MITLLLLIPLAAMAGLVLGAPPKPTAVAAALANFLLSLALAVRFIPGAAGFQFEWRAPWIAFEPQTEGSIFAGLPPIACHLGLDGISLPLLLLATVVSLAAISIAPRHPPHGGAAFYGLLLAVSLGLVGVFISLDLFFASVFAAFSVLPMFLLIGGWGGRNRRFAGLQLALYLGLGGLLLFLAIVALMAALPPSARTFDLSRLPFLTGRGGGPLLGPQIAPLLFGLFLAGCGILIPLFPLHTWSAPAMGAAPVPAAMLHGAVFKNVGLYLLLRVAWPLFPVAVRHGHGWLIGLCLVQVFFLGLGALAQIELPLLLGGWSAMRTGGLLLGLVAWDRAGLAGLVLWMTADGLAFALLFAVAGEIARRTGESRLMHWSGMARRMPCLAGLMALGLLALLGFPGLPNLAGETAVFAGALPHHGLAAKLLLGGVAAGAFLLLVAVASFFFGAPPVPALHGSDLPPGQERRPYYFLGGALLVLGLLAEPVLRMAGAAAAALLGGMP